jgi:uncharacterized protein
MMWLTLWLMGFVGSLHCVGMCLPLQLFVLAKEDRLPLLKQLGIYHIGRILMYGFLGLMIASFNVFVFLVQGQKWILMGLGLALLVSVISRYIRGKSLPDLGLNRQLRQWSHRHQKNYFVLGMINGLVPCGMVYTALAFSFFSHTMIEGWIGMMMFGLGTLPLLVSMPFLHQLKWVKQILASYPIEQIVTTVVALFMVYTSLNIDMPREASFWQATTFPVMCH